jgi:hypothetical protein
VQDLANAMMRDISEFLVKLFKKDFFKNLSHFDVKFFKRTINRFCTLMLFTGFIQDFNNLKLCSIIFQNMNSIVLLKVSEKILKR